MSETSDRKDNERHESEGHGKAYARKDGFRNGNRRGKPQGKSFHGGKKRDLRADGFKGEGAGKRQGEMSGRDDSSKPRNGGRKPYGTSDAVKAATKSKNTNGGRRYSRENDQRGSSHGKPDERFAKAAEPVIEEKSLLIDDETAQGDFIEVEEGYQERKIRPESEILHVLKNGSEKKLLSLLGFAARGRKLICGTDLCRDSIRRNVAIITIVASDASENTKKRIIDACRYYGSDMCVAPVGSAELSHMIGKTGEIMVISVTDRHFADGISALFEDGGSN